jgi:Flp pilus assembly protein TadG
MLEAALVMLPLLAIGLAMLDFPLGVFIQNTLRNAAREGVRYAITQQTGSGGQDAAIRNVIKQNSVGFVSDADLSASRSTISIQYYDPVSLVEVTGNRSNAGGNICVITATVQHAWMAPLWRTAGLLTYSASSSDVMEAPPNGILPGR